MTGFFEIRIVRDPHAKGRMWLLGHPTEPSQQVFQ